MVRDLDVMDIGLGGGKWIAGTGIKTQMVNSGMIPNMAFNIIFSLGHQRPAKCNRRIEVSSIRMRLLPHSNGKMSKQPTSFMPNRLSRCPMSTCEQQNTTRSASDNT